MTRTSIAIATFAAAMVVAISSVDLSAQKDPKDNKAATPVFDVNEAAKKPVAYWTKLYFPGGKEGPKGEYPGDVKGGRAVYMESEDFVVPEGSVLVLEYANAVACFGPDGEKMSIGIKTNYNRAGSDPANLKIVQQAG